MRNYPEKPGSRWYTDTCFLIIVFLISSCNTSQDKEQKKTDTPTSGSISVFADDSFRPLIDAEVQAFENLYVQSDIQTQYGTEHDAVEALLNDKADVIIITRELNQEEKSFITKKTITVRSNKIATDALAFLVNDAFPDSLLNTAQLKAIFTGKVKKWNELAGYLPSTEIEIVTDKGSSSNLNFLKESLGLQPETVKISAAGSNVQVMEYVKKNKTSLGIVGANWISDEDDPELKSKLENLKVLALAEGDEKDRSRYCQPLQAYIAEGKYPVARPVYMIVKTTHTGLNAGFASYVLSDNGQRIILKAGLLPAVMPGREISVRKDDM